MGSPADSGGRPLAALLRAPRINGGALQRLKAAHLRERPLCVRCLRLGLTRVATELDHIVPMFKGGADTRDPFENRQGLCTPCHRAKTAEDMGHTTGKGCDATGLPTDPLHPWNLPPR